MLSMMNFDWAWREKNIQKKSFENKVRTDLLFKNSKVDIDLEK